MRYQENWDACKRKFLEYWALENHDRPLIAATAPKDGARGEGVCAPATLRDRWLDTEYVIRCGREGFENTYFGGEALPILWPNVGPDFFGALFGCDLEFGENTSWAHPCVEDWDALKPLALDPRNVWWKKMVEMTTAMADDARGDYLVGITDIHSGADGLVSLRGPQNLCLDLADCPDAVKRVNFEMLEVYQAVVRALHAIASRDQEGSTNWMRIWHPKLWYVTSCDFSCMISPNAYAEFCLDEIRREIDFLDASVYHLDGPGALKHLDALLQIPNLNGIQWVYGAGQPTARHWIPILKKIQEAGKTIQVDIVPDDLGPLLEALRPEGVMYMVHCGSEQDARDLIRKAERARKRNLF